MAAIWSSSPISVVLTNTQLLAEEGTYAKIQSDFSKTEFVYIQTHKSTDVHF